MSRHRTILGVLMMVLGVRAWAVELNPVCHTLYEQFGQSNLSYEDVGKIADEMHANVCWPALQGANSSVETPLALP